MRTYAPFSRNPFRMRSSKKTGGRGFILPTLLCLQSGRRERVCPEQGRGATIPYLPPPIPFVFNRFRTLWQKRPGVGYPLSAIIPPRIPGGVMSFSQRLQEIRDGFERPFWVANMTEIFERLSYYGAFASLANYLHEKLNFPTEQTGTLTGIFGGMVWFLAIFGGAIADRLGFRRALSLAYLILAAAYF